MSNIHCVCGYAGKLVPEVIDALNGNGPAPNAVTIGGEVFVFVDKSSSPGNYAALIRHENKHVEQSARYCPWIFRFLPLRARAWIGAPKFWKLYVDEHAQHGYNGNKYENEARLAE